MSLEILTYRPDDVKPVAVAKVTGTYRDDNEYHDGRGRRWTLDDLHPDRALPGFWTGIRNDGVQVSLHRSAITFHRI